MNTSNIAHAPRAKLGRAVAARTIALWSLALFVGAGWIVATTLSVVVVALVVAVAVCLLVARVNRGAFVGLAVVAVANGIPWIDFAKYAVHGRFRPADVIIFFLFVSLGYWKLTERRPGLTVPNWVHLWSITLIVWWTITLLRTVLFDGVPALQAALFGRDFLYFAIALPLIAGSLKTLREVVGLFAVLLATALVFAVAQLAAQLSHADVGWILHPVLITEFQGVQRYYSAVGDILFASVPLSVGLALLGTGPRQRLAGVAVAVIGTMALALSLTRAVYLGLIVGMALATGAWLFGRGARFERFRAAMAVSVAAGVAIFAASGLFRAHIIPSSITGVVSARVAVGYKEITTRSGNFGYRYDIYQRMLHVLDGRWPIGLGFWHPAKRPVEGLPANSIRNGDVGVMNAVMTMGVVGALLIYFPVLATVWALLARRGRQFESTLAWARFGATVWLISILVSSATLITLFTTEGLLVTAAIVAPLVLLFQRSTGASTA